MDTKSVDVDVHVMGWFHPQPSGFLSEIIINQDREFEDLIIDENDHMVTSFGSYKDSSPPPDPLIYLKFQNFEPNFIYQLVESQLHDHVMSKQISDKVVVKAQQLRSQQSSDLPLYIVVTITFTQKEYIVVPCYCALSDKESEEEETETCVICLENMLESGLEVKPIYHMPHCSHLFHEECVFEWLNQQKSSCPLCRQPVYQYQECNRV